MENEFDDLENIIDIVEEEVVEIDYTDKTKKVFKKLIRKIIVVFVSTVIILSTAMIDRHDDFDVVLKSNLFILLLLLSVIAGMVLLIFTYKTKNRYNEAKVYKFHKRFTDIYDMLTIVPVIMVLLTVSNIFFLSPSFISGASMEPAYYDGDDIVFWHLNVEYERYDVVILKAQTGDYWIKRIIGLPGDTVIIDSGIVTVNGVEIYNEFLRNKDGSIDYYTICRDGDPDYCEYNVPDGEYFVLGDNRDVSDDSRSLSLGYVTEDQLYGKVIYKFNNIFRN